MAIKKSIRSLYRIIGGVVGKQVWDRISVDENISSDPIVRKEMAYRCIDYITKFRKILSSKTRSPEQIIELMQDKTVKHEDEIKLASWILEAFLLLNQSSTASADVTKTLESDKIFSRDLVDRLLDIGISKEDLEKVFSEYISASLVLTAHPTAGIQPDYMYHIANMVERVQEIAEVIREGDNNLVLEHKLKSIQDDLASSISHMVRVKPYNENKLKPSDESRNFLDAVSQIYEIIPEKLLGLEATISDILAKDFKFKSNFFRVHSWVARDIDGNPTVSPKEHFKSLVQENIFFLQRYYLDIQKLWKILSDDFSLDKDLPGKTFFRDEKFKAYYDLIIKSNPVLATNKQAYRLVIEHCMLKPLSQAIEDLEALHVDIYNYDKYNFEYNFSKFSIDEVLLEPLKAILANKEGYNSKEIEKLIKKLEVFSLFGSKGHTRQGNEIINYIISSLLDFKEYGDIDKKSEFLISPMNKLSDMPAKIRSFASKLAANKSKSKKDAKALQTLELLSLIPCGGMQRQIISMNTCFEDMLNALVLITCFGAFNFNAKFSKNTDKVIDIVPLTEQISDLRNSYQCTIEALTNKVWRKYLLLNGFKFIKMRGPSDSGKQNGFTASQWEMFRSKQLDTIAVEIFNAFVLKHVHDDASQLEAWELYRNSEDKDISNSKENDVVNLAFENFAPVFENFQEEKPLWLEAAEFFAKDKAYVEIVSFDGWGEPVERGGGLEFKNTATCTQPLGSNAHYERTLQGGGAQQLVSAFRSHEIIQDFISAISEISARNIYLDNLSQNKSLYYLDSQFVKALDKMVKHIRTKLRTEVLGLDLDSDSKCADEAVLRDYFSHIVKSPLIYLDLFNIASRPTSRSGTKIKEVLAQEEYANDLDLFAKNLAIEEVLAILADVRAIPYSAMFNLLGGNHVSFYGYQGLEEDTELLQVLEFYYHSRSDSQEARLLRHIMDSLERGIFTSDLDTYEAARNCIETVTKPDYNSKDDTLLQKLIYGNQATRNFIARVKKYPIADAANVKLSDLLQDKPDERDLLIARRNDAAVPRLGIAYSIANIIADSKARNVNPLAIETMQIRYLDLLRKAFAAGASTFGNGCID